MSKGENIEQEFQGRWPLLAAVVLLAIELFFGSGCTVPRTSESAKPNIIFILTDDQDLETLAHMPRVQALLVKQGLTFKNAFVTTPLCCPSRASILTGQYPHNNDILRNAPPLGGFVKFRDLGREGSTVATWLKAAGYRTALFGKYLNGYPGRRQSNLCPARLGRMVRQVRAWSRHRGLFRLQVERERARGRPWQGSVGVPD